MEHKNADTDKLEFIEDDPRNIISFTNEGDELSSGSSFAIRGIGLDLKKCDVDLQDIVAKQVQEQNVMVIFELPDGSQSEPKYFRLGQTVEFLKSFVETEFGIPMTEQKLFLDGKRMLDPLSLLDFPDAKGLDELYIVVQGNLPEHSRK